MCKEHQGHHHHTHQYKNKRAGILVSHHEEATVFTVTREFPLSYNEALKIIPSKLDELSTWVDRNGGLVGHIKGSLTDTSHYAMLSTTGAPCSVIETTAPTVKLGLTCIVFMVDEEKMCEKIAQSLTFSD